MSGGFTVGERKVLEGIPVLSTGDPVEATLVCAQDMKMFGNWCRASMVRHTSGNVRYVSLDKSTPQFRGIGLNSPWRWIVFVASDPRCYIPGDPFAELNRLRTAGQFTRAWVYPHLWIDPQVYDNAATLGMDEWEGF